MGNRFGYGAWFPFWFFLISFSGLEDDSSVVPVVLHSPFLLPRNAENDIVLGDLGDV